MWFWDEGHMDGTWGVVMAVGMMGVWVALIAAVVFAIVWATRNTNGPSYHTPTGGTAGSGAGDSESAEQILAKRLAQGEIDPDEYRTRLDVLVSRSQR